jgi:coenzyme F420-reducing hydrogenase delta subunit
LACPRALADGLDLEGRDWSTARGRVRVLLAPCGSKPETFHLLQSLAEGVDGIEIIACRDGRCAAPGGPARLEKRVAYATRLLGEVGIEPQRIGMDRGEGLTAEQVAALIAARLGAVAALGANPMKKRRNDR